MAIHFGHRDIHKHQIRWCQAVGRNCQSPIGSLDKACDRPLQNFARYKHIGSVVFGDKQAKPGARCSFSHIKTGVLCHARARQSQRDGKDRSLGRNRCHGNITPHLLGQQARNGQPKAGATELTRNRTVGLGETVEHLPDPVCGDADACVGNGDFDTVTLALRLDRNDSLNMALHGELYGISQ